MDVLIVLGIVVALVVPIYPALIRMNRSIGRLEGEIKHLNGHDKDQFK